MFIEPFHRMFFINDLNISYPHAIVERVSVGKSWCLEINFHSSLYEPTPIYVFTDLVLGWNFVYALYIPLGVLLAYNAATQAPIAKYESTILPFAIAISLASLITDIVKNAVGRPRPDLLARCQPSADTKPNVLVTIAVCTAPNDHTLHDGWRSFPSGHSSFSFAGLGFVSLFFAGQLGVFRNGTVEGRDLSRALLCMAPLLGALMIAISRCEDYRHDVYDVCVGSVLGMTVSYWSYRRHWPKLSSAKSDEPLPRLGSDEDQGWGRVRDEEDGFANGNGQENGNENGHGVVGYQMARLS